MAGLLAFLSSLAGGGLDDEDENGQTPPHSWMNDADGYLVPQYGQPQPSQAQQPVGPSPSPMSPTAPMAEQAPAPYYPESPAPAPTPAENDITVRGDSWSPRKQTVLGAIADAIASYTDDGTPFADARDKRNMMEASQTMTSDPMKAIRRISKIDPKTAWELLNQAQDNVRQQGGLDRQNRALDLQNENLLFTRAAGMMRVATPANWQAMREQALKFGQTRGMDLSQYIPEQYDPDSIAFFAAGAIPPAKQAQLEETGQHHRATERIGQQNADTRSRYTDAAIQQGGARIGISQQNADTSSRNADTSERREAKAAGNVRATHQTKYGPAVIDPDGQHMVLYPTKDKAPKGYDGKGLNYINVDGTWVPANTTPNE